MFAFHEGKVVTATFVGAFKSHKKFNRRTHEEVSTSGFRNEVWVLWSKKIIERKNRGKQTIEMEPLEDKYCFSEHSIERCVKKSLVILFLKDHVMMHLYKGLSKGCSNSLRWDKYREQSLLIWSAAYWVEKGKSKQLLRFQWFGIACYKACLSLDALFFIWMAGHHINLIYIYELGCFYF